MSAQMDLKGRDMADMDQFAQTVAEMEAISKGLAVPEVARVELVVSDQQSHFVNVPAQMDAGYCRQLLTNVFGAPILAPVKEPETKTKGKKEPKE